MRHRAACWIVAVVPLVACSLAVDLDGLTAGDGDGDATVVSIEGGVIYLEADGASPVDANVPLVTGDAAGEAATDAETDADADGGTGLDAAGQMDGAARDGATDVDAGPFCLGAAAYSVCSDFDEGSLTFGYTTDGLHWGNNTLGGGDVRLDSDASTSPPDSLFSELVASDGGIAEGASFSLNLPTTTKAVRVEMDVLPAFSAPLPFGQVNIFSLFEIVPPTQYFGSSFGAYQQGTFLNNGFESSDGGVGGTSVDVPSLPANRWTHVTVAVTRLPAGHITLSYGTAAPVLDETINVASSAASELLLVVGLTASGSFPTVIAHFDNIVVDITP